MPISNEIIIGFSSGARISLTVWPTFPNKLSKSDEAFLLVPYRALSPAIFLNF